MVSHKTVFNFLYNWRVKELGPVSLCFHTQLFNNVKNKLDESQSAVTITILVSVFQAYLDHSPQEVFDVLVPSVCDWPKWNPTILGCEVSLKKKIRKEKKGGETKRS